jgi:hypothetical protein
MRFGFCFVKFGDRSCVLPSAPESFLVPLPEIEPDSAQIGQAPSRFSDLAGQLLNPLYQNKAKKELFEAASDERLLTMDNAVYVHRLIAKWPYAAEPRMFLQGLFRAVSLRSIESRAVNCRLMSECFVRVCEAQAQTGNAQNYSFSTLPIPTFTKAELPQYRQGSPAPEVYISDAELVAITGVDRITFYERVTEEQRGQVRAYLLG